MFGISITFISFKGNPISVGFPSFAPHAEQNSPLPAFFARQGGISPSADGDQGYAPWISENFLKKVLSKTCDMSVNPDEYRYPTVGATVGRPFVAQI